MKTDKKYKKNEAKHEDQTKLKTELEEYKAKYLRALADYQNLENRIREERQELFKIANKQFILKLLPFLDNLNKAEIFLKDEGMKMIKNEFLEILKQEGVEELDIEGEEFDPQCAEAIDIGPGTRDNIILEVVRSGYKMNGKVLRPAQVKVSKKVDN